MQKICHNIVYKTYLKLDLRTFLDAYNLLAYGKTLSEKSWKSQNVQNKSNISDMTLFV